MSASCCAPSPTADPVFRRVLWIALVVNAAMFAVEVVAGYGSGSTSLLADAIDFAGDAANYALSLAVLSLSLRARSGAALVKAACMAIFGMAVILRAVWAWQQGVVPGAMTMGVVGSAALVANVGVAALLYRHRAGDADRRSVWICSRNDAIGNALVVLAAVGVFGSGSAIPDLLVAIVIATLALTGSLTVLRQVRVDLGRAGS